MREIKFRAYDTELKQMLTPKEIDCYYIADANSEEYLHFMQYTGLKDKNGVEIYEGDIVKCVTTSGVNETSTYIGVIEYPEYESGFFLKVKSTKTIKTIDNTIITETKANNYWTTLKHHANEVIGNIYENKDLLK